jgi:uncharacterized protein YaeQ
MALKATIFKAVLHIANMDRHYYHTHHLTIARHPSENDERMMARILTFTLHADDRLEFSKGLSTEDEPDLWQKTLGGEIELWVELGQPDEKRLRKACGRSKQVVIYTYQDRAAAVWWNHNQYHLNRFENLSVISLPENSLASLTKLTQRSMQLQCTIQDGVVWINDINESVTIEPKNMKSPLADNK